ncbi:MULTISPECIES: hypothetical protein [unclassified Dysgonomonas]|uniref:hypothetical protein n=1 Tax=unclassified Dysgonomonas TaxID=2630389 RepID=UPI0025BF94AF|nr:MULTISPECIES: hypothetical protein [unclassified Dysgonomonas]HMM02752.1 hypothetical protein [Dysgonomonas sp.]
MKKLFVLGSVLSLLIITSCDKNECGCDTAPVNEKSYIQGFSELGEIQLSIGTGAKVDKAKNTITYGSENGLSIGVFIGDGGKGRGAITWDNSNADYYNKLVERIGDISYNKYPNSGITWANADTLQVITIICDKPMDDSHPAGCSLNDLFSIYFLDICALVKNGYKPVTGSKYFSIVNEYYEYPYTLFGDRLSSVNLVEKPHIGIDIDLILEAVPEHTDEYTFTVSVTNKQGKTIEKTTEPVRIKGAD